MLRSLYAQLILARLFIQACTYQNQIMMHMRKIYVSRKSLVAIFIFFLFASSSAYSGNSTVAYQLNIAHVNDTHSNIRPPDVQELLIDGQRIYAPLGGFGQLITLFKSLDQNQ
jgi:hypothetical protein